jgi:hypothetical protein
LRILLRRLRLLLKEKGVENQLTVHSEQLTVKTKTSAPPRLCERIFFIVFYV